jgi:hypothetical protein
MYGLRDMSNIAKLVGRHFKIKFGSHLVRITSCLYKVIICAANVVIESSSKASTAFLYIALL